MTDLLQKMKSVGVYHFSPSPLNRPIASWMFEYVYLSKDKRREIIVGENAALGSAAHEAIQAVVCHGQDIDEAVKHSTTGFDFHPANQSPEKREKFRELIPEIAATGIDLLSGMFAGAQEEKKIELMLPDVVVPIIGYVDLFKDGQLAEIKTKAPRMGMVKKDMEEGDYKVFEGFVNMLGYVTDSDWLRAVNKLPAGPQRDYLMMQYNTKVGEQDGSE